MKKEILDKFIEIIKENEYTIQEDVILKPYTSLNIGGKARLFSEPSSIEEITLLINTAKDLDIPYYIIGNGSNILVLDEGVAGLVILLKTNFNKITLLNDDMIKATSGTLLSQLCLFAYENSLSGLEFAWGIPASVGGAVYMNAGAYGGETKDVLVSCTYIDEDKNLKTMRNNELNFSYRHSFFNEKNICILEAVFQLKKGNKVTIKEKMDELYNLRESKQPLEYHSAGSTFKRPQGNYASALIEQSGLKGYVYKNAMVSSKHAGFVVNHNNASSTEFIELIDYVKKVVKQKTGYELECEIKIMK